MTNFVVLIGVPKNPGLLETFNYDFSTSGESDQFEYLGSKANIKYDSNGMNMPCIKPNDAPTVGSKFYIFWGKVDIVMKAAPGAGIISSLVLQSSSRDEIDLEFVGLQDTQVQTNIFRKGDRDHSDPGNSTVAQPQTQWHKYTLDWKHDSLTYSIDDQVVRVIERSDNPGLYPQTPCNIRIGSWPAGDSNSTGTVEWAQGPVDYTKGPFNMMVKSITIENYTPAAEYTYIDKTGSQDSVKIIKDAVDTSSTSTSTVAASTTTSAKSTSTSTKDVETTTSAKTTSTKTTSAITSTVANSTVTATGSATTTLSTTTGAGTTSSGTGTSTSASVSATQPSSASIRSASVVSSLVIALMAAVFVL